MSDSISDNRERADKRKGDGSTPNKYRKIVKKKEYDVKVRKERKKDTKPRKTKYSHLTDEERQEVYRQKINMCNLENYKKNIDRERERRKQYYYANKEKILAKQKLRRAKEALAGANIDENKQIGRPRKY